jgi:hypothetical protein
MKGFLISFAVTLIVVVLMLLLWPAPAFSQVLMSVPVHCVPGKMFIERLGKKFSEKLSGYGIADGLLVQHYQSKSGGWTIIILNQQGMACTIAFGTDWQGVTVIDGEPS